MTAPADDNPFAPTPSGPTRLTAASRQQGGGGAMLWLGLGALALTAAGAAYWLLASGTAGARSGVPADMLVVDNPSRSYRLAVPNDGWVRRDALAREDEHDVVFQAGERPAWLRMTSGPVAAGMRSLGELADATFARWAKDIPELRRGPVGSATVAGAPASRLTAGGRHEYRGEEQRLEAVVFEAGGHWYRLTLAATPDLFPEVRPALDRCVEHFRLLDGESPAAPPASSVRTLVRSETQYSLTVPKDQWRENEDLPGVSRFADMKLADRSGKATIVVTPRRTDDLAAFQNAYVNREQRLTGGELAVREVDPGLTVDGRQARRIQVRIDSDFGVATALVTFVAGDSYQYQVECRADAADYPQFEAAFRDIVATMKVGPQQPSADTPSAVAATPPAEQSDPAAHLPAAEPQPTVAEAAPAATPPATDAPATDAPATDAPAAAQGRRSLDDLGTDTPEKSEQPAPKPPAADTPADAGDRPSLDDL